MIAKVNGVMIGHALGNALGFLLQYCEDSYSVLKVFKKQNVNQLNTLCGKWIHYPFGVTTHLQKSFEIVLSAYLSNYEEVIEITKQQIKNEFKPGKIIDGCNACTSACISMNLNTNKCLNDCIDCCPISQVVAVVLNTFNDYSECINGLKVIKITHKSLEVEEAAYVYSMFLITCLEQEQHPYYDSNYSNEILKEFQKKLDIHLNFISPFTSYFLELTQRSLPYITFDAFYERINGSSLQEGHIFVTIGWVIISFLSSPNCYHSALNNIDKSHLDKCGFSTLLLTLYGSLPSNFSKVLTDPVIRYGVGINYEACGKQIDNNE
ncbi:hypothetical protein QTN25_005138 [Entamoeba marina]